MKFTRSMSADNITEGFITNNQLYHLHFKGFRYTMRRMFNEPELTRKYESRNEKTKYIKGRFEEYSIK